MKTEKKASLKGFTLVELVVVIAVFGLLIAATLSFLAPTSRIMKNTSEYAHAAGMVDNVRRTVEDNLRYANRLYVYTGPDVSGGEKDFVDTEVNKLRNDFLLGTASSSTGNQRLTFGRDEVYVMKIHNTETFQNISSAADKPGRVTIWKYDGGVRNDAESKEWAISPAVYRDYSFSLSFGVNFNTVSERVAGSEKDMIQNTTTYEPFANFADPRNFALQLDIYSNEYSDRSSKETSDYSLSRTSVSNTLAISFVNLADSKNTKKEEISYIDHSVTGTSGDVIITIDPERYKYTPNTYSHDLYFIYTIPDIN